MRATLLAGLCLMVLVGTASAQQMTKKEWIAAKKAEAEAIREANKAAVLELNTLKNEMLQMGMKAEVKDCEKILDRCLDPNKKVSMAGGSTPWPGEENYDKLLDRFGEVGGKLSALYAQVAAVTLDETLKEEYDKTAKWLGTFPGLAKRMRHFNRRRKECKMGPVTLSWSSSWGGFMHGRYLSMNRGHPSTAGLGAHNENSSLPGYSSEGAAAAKGIGGGGWFDGWMGSAFHRQPVFSPRCSRINFGGYANSYWCKQISGSNKPLTDLLTWPADGGSGYSGVFGGEAPDPLPKGTRSAGTMIIIKYLKGKPKSFSYKLFAPGGTEITDFIECDKRDATAVFCPRNHLAGGKYELHLLGVGYKKVVTFTIGGAGSPYSRISRVRPPRQTPGQTPGKTPKPPTKPVKMPDKPAISGTPDVPEKPEPPKKAAPPRADPLKVAVTAALKTQPLTPERAKAVVAVRSAWDAAKLPAKEAVLREFGIDKLLGLGVDQIELTQIHQHTKDGQKPPAKRYKPIRKGEEPPEEPTPAKVVDLSAPIDAVLGASGDARAAAVTKLAGLWKTATLEAKLAALEKYGVAKLGAAGLPKKELKELDDF